MKCLCTKKLNRVHHTAEMEGMGLVGAVWFHCDCMHMLNACKMDKEGQGRQQEAKDSWRST